MMSPGGDDVHLTLAHPAPGWELVRLEGELDAWSSAAVEDRLFACCQGERPRVIVDLADIDFIDSSGIRLLVQMVARSRPGGTVILVRPRKTTPRRALEIVGMQRACPMVESVEEALHASEAEPKTA